MKQKKVVVGVALANSRAQKHEIRSALTWLDLKVEEFLDKYHGDKEYRNSDKMRADFFEILGILKFAYMSEIISLTEFKHIVKNITGEDMTDEEVKSL